MQHALGTCKCFHLFINHEGTETQAQHSGGRGTGEAWSFEKIPLTGHGDKCAKFVLQKDEKGIGIHCRLHKDCRMNRAFTKSPLGTLAAWEALVADPTLTKKEHQDAREDETKLTYRNRKSQRQ